MHKFVSFNQQILPANQARISALSSAALYGKSIFTTLAVYDSKPFLWDKHWARLLNNAFRIGLNLDFSEESVAESLAQLISQNKVATGRARLTLFDESAGKIWSGEIDKKVSLLITTAPLRAFSEQLKVTVSPYRINSASPLSNLKSGNYLENLLALEEAQKRGFAEAVRLNEKDEVVSACLANVFWLKNDELFTPALSTGCLAGTTREFILENRQVYEVKETIENLENSDAVFLTSSGLGSKQIIFAENHTKLPKHIDLLAFAK